MKAAVSYIIEKEIALLTWLIEKLWARRSIVIDRQEEACALIWPTLPKQ